MTFGFITNALHVSKDVFWHQTVNVQPYECVRHDAVLYLRNMRDMLLSLCKKYVKNLTQEAVFFVTD